MQALEKINESNVASSDPSSALRFDEPEKKCQCWDKKWFAALVVFSWIFIAGGVALTVLSHIQWDKCSKDYIDSKEEYRRSEIAVEGMKNLVNTTRQKLGKINESLEKLAKEFEDSKKQLQKLEAEHIRLKEELAQRLQVLNHTEEEYKKVKAENDNIRHNITEKEEKIRNLTQSIEDLKRDLIVIEKEITAFKAPTYTAGGLFVAGLGYDIYIYIRLLSARSELARLEHFNKGYEAVAKGFESYEILTRKIKQQVKRTNCYNWPKESKMSRCENQGPTMTTINTHDGYRFGAVFHGPWPTTQGRHSDPKAYTFSDTVGMEANIQIDNDALIIGRNLLQFGETDIVIAVGGRSGVAVGHSYRVPPPYENKTFYYNGTFHVKGIDIDVLTIVPVP